MGETNSAVGSVKKAIYLDTGRRPRRAAKPSPKQLASEWPQDSVNGSWRAFALGLRVEAGKSSRGLPRPAKDEGAGDG